MINGNSGCLNSLFMRFILMAFYRWYHSKLFKHSSRNECENSSHILERTQKSPLKHWIHFLLSSLWPPTSNMLWKNNRTTIIWRCKDTTGASVFFSVAAWPVLLPVGPQHTAGAQPRFCTRSPSQGMHTWSSLWSQPLPRGHQTAGGALLRAACSVHPSGWVSGCSF